MIPEFFKLNLYVICTHCIENGVSQNGTIIIVHQIALVISNFDYRMRKTLMFMFSKIYGKITNPINPITFNLDPP